MNVFILTIAFVVIVLFLVFISLQTPYRWQYKAGIILISSLFYVVVWHTLPKLQGWPIKESLPDEFRLVSRYVVQPSKQADTPGAIYMWVVDLGEDAPRLPRAFELPYTTDLHEDLIDASKSGAAQKGERVEQSGSAVDGEPAMVIKFQPMPKKRPPPK